MKKKRFVLYTRVDEDANRWVTEQAAKQGISKNDVVQMLINKEMKKHSTV